jgi:ATP-dependent DNA ligase
MAKKKLIAPPLDHPVRKPSKTRLCTTARGERSLAGLGIPLTLAPMEAKSVSALPTDPGWQFEPKWDGFRCLAFRAGKAVECRRSSERTR